MIDFEFKSMEAQQVSTAAELVRSGLKASYDVHENLGEAGVTAVQPNQFGDDAMVADIESERVLIDKLKQSGLDFDVRSEEHGSFPIRGRSAEFPRMLSVLDGLDGSSLYKKARGTGNYGTMLAIFGNNNPRYDQYLAAGIMLHSTAQLLLAVRGQGVTVLNLKTGEETITRTSSEELKSKSLVYVDDDATVSPEKTLYPYFQTNLHVFAEKLRYTSLDIKRTGASAGYYAALALGEAMAVGEATRKGNLELAAAYAIATEAGGSIVDVKTWKDIGNLKFLEYGQNSHEPFLATANPNVLKALKLVLGANAGERAVR